jgi:hypothetical protein
MFIFAFVHYHFYLLRYRSPSNLLGQSLNQQHPLSYVLFD